MKFLINNDDNVYITMIFFSRKINKLPAKTPSFCQLRKDALKSKFGSLYKYLPPLKDFKRCLEVNARGEPLMHWYDFEGLMGTNKAASIERVQKVLHRTKVLDKAKRIPINPFSHIIASMYLLRSDISPLIWHHSHNFSETLKKDNIHLQPFLSLNNYSFLSSLLKDKLPDMLKKDTINNLFSEFERYLGPKVGWPSTELPFCESHTDFASQIIYNFLQRIKNRWSKAKDLRQRKNIEISRTISRLKAVGAADIEYAFVPRNHSFFEVGDKAGDCSSLDNNSQFDTGTINTFPDVPLWIGMPNYQILNAYYNHTFVMKFHLVVAMVQGKWSLVIDGTETTPLVRDDSKIKDPKLINVRERIFLRGLTLIKKIGKSMGNIPILIEPFSNTKWVRDTYSELPPKIIYVKSDIDIQKTIKPLEDFLIEQSAETRGLLNKYMLMPQLQISNLDLWEQGLIKGYKMLHILHGAKKDTSLPIRGV